MSTDADELGGALEHVAARQPAAAALQVRGRPPLRYADLGAQIAYVRSRFAEWGIAPGDVVAGFAPTRAEMLVASATLPASSTFAPLGAALTPEQCVELLRRLQPKAVLTGGQRDQALTRAARELDVAEICVTAQRDAPAGRFTLDLARAAESLSRPAHLAAGCAFVMVTSGTSGRAKLVALEHGKLLRQARFMKDWLRLDPGDVSCHLLPPHLAHAIGTGLVNPLLAGHSIVCLGAAGVEEFFRAFDDFAPTYLSAGFTVYRELLRRAPEHRDRLARSRLRFLRVGSGRLEPEEIDRLEQAFGVPVLKGLTLTEGAATQDPLPPGMRKPDALGLPLANEIAILREPGKPADATASGEIVMRGPTLFSGYVDDPELNAQSFVDGWFRTGDAGYLDRDGYLNHTGRIKEMINRGGEKFSPADIDAALESLAGVKEAAAFGVPHPRLGEEVAAAVVRESGSELREQDVIQHARRRIGLAAAPRRVYFLDRLPRNDGGKLRRSELREIVGDAVPMALSPEAGARSFSPLETAVAGLFAATLRRPVGPEEPFFLAGGDSLNGAHLLAQIRTVFGVDLPIRVLFDEGASVTGMARLIQRMRAGEPGSPAEAVAARSFSRQPTPLSATQRRAWFLWKLDPGNSAYNEVRVHRLCGPLDLAALQQAVERLVRRHAILRSTYSMLDGEPMQIVDDRTELGVELVDLSASTARDRDVALDEVLVAMAGRPFDLEAGPLARFIVVRLGDCEHVLVRIWHHIVGDGVSAAIFERELSAAYAALVLQRPLSLPPLPLEYSDYAAWQAERLRSDALQRQLDYWKRKLEGVPNLHLPTDRVRPPVRSFRGARVESELSKALFEKLASLGRSAGATPFMTLLAAFSLLLHRYTGDEDIVIGTPIAGRNRTELEGLIGFFANTLALRIELSSEPTFLELLGRVRETALDAYSNQELPFERLVEALAPKRDPGRNPLFQVCFTMQATSWNELALEGIEVRRVLPPTTQAKFDLLLSVRPIDEGMTLIWEYSAELFAPETLQRMAAHFHRLLEEVAAQPQRPVGRIPMQSAGERALVKSWSRARSDYPHEATVAQLFHAQAMATPDAVAVVDDRRRLTYGELDARAGKLANFLRASGVESGARVGICLERTPGLIVAMLAILKAGAAYVPIDPEAPRERVHFFVRDGCTAIVLTRSPHLALFDGAPCRALCLDRERDRIASLPADAGTPPGNAGGLACVMYTSGSTGEPKGVAVPHRAIVRLVCNANYVQLSSADVVAQLANPAFDAVTFEIWGALLNAGRVAIVPRETLLAPRSLAAALERHAVTTLFLTTALFNQMAHDAPEGLAGRVVLFGGEAADPAAVAAALRAGRPKRLLHVYGPTEATTFATWLEIRELDAQAITVPIGRPIANTEVYILDRYREPVPVGVAGEIYIGGPGVALGYLGRPQLTAERFVAHPFDSAPDARLYRTGDRARYRADGAIEFVGRMDRQVKIRGHRVEPGEIEAALLRLPEVREAVVDVREDTPDGRSLIGYVVPRADSRPSSSELTSALRQCLPHYMIPTALVVLDALPLTRQGKVDRRALPRPSALAEHRTGQHARPRDPLQHMLAEIWEELLDVRDVGVEDNFFDLGGHSLLAARMMDAVEQACGRSLPLTVLFRGATIAELARALAGAAKVVRDPITPVNAAGSRPPFFFLHGDFTGGGFYSRELARALGGDQPFYAVHPHGLIDADVPDSIEAMAADRLRAIRQTRPQGPYALGGHCNGALVALELARLLLAQGQSVPVLILMDAWAPWRATRVFDGVSIGRQRLRSERPPAESLTPLPSIALEAPVPVEKTTLYRRAMAAYAPKHYPGRVVVLRSEENKDLRPSLGWSAIARELETHALAGNHHTSITRHVASTGARIKAVLDAAFEQAGLPLHRAMQ